MARYRVVVAVVGLAFTLSSCSYIASWLQGPTGPAGQDGISIVWLGSYSTAPGSPSTNDAYYNTTDGVSYIWDGSEWQVLAQDGMDGLDGLNGIDGTNGVDGTNGANGLSIVWLGSFPTAPLSPTTNEAYYDTTDGRSYLWDGASWQILAQDGFLDVAVTLTFTLGQTAVGFTDDSLIGREFTVMLDADVDPTNANEIPIYNGKLAPGQGLVSDFPDDYITVSFSVPTGTATSGWYTVFVWIEDDADDPNGDLFNPGIVNNGTIDPHQDLIYAVGNRALATPNVFFPSGGAANWTLYVEATTLNYLWP